jgi:hypothetical protein
VTGLSRSPVRREALRPSPDFIESSGLGGQFRAGSFHCSRVQSSRVSRSSRFLFILLPRLIDFLKNFDIKTLRGRRGPSRRHVLHASAPRKIFVRRPQKTFATKSARNGHRLLADAVGARQQCGCSGRERIRYRENVRGTCASRNLSGAVDGVDDRTIQAEAVLRIARELPRWQWTWIFQFIPRVIRDAIYDWSRAIAIAGSAVVTLASCRIRIVRGRREPPRDCGTMAPDAGWLRPA